MPSARANATAHVMSHYSHDAYQAVWLGSSGARGWAIASATYALWACSSPVSGLPDADGSSRPEVAANGTNLSMFALCSDFKTLPLSCYSDVVKAPDGVKTCAQALALICQFPSKTKLFKGTCDNHRYVRNSATLTEQIWLCDQTDLLVGYQQSSWDGPADCPCLNQGELPFCITSTTLPACE